MKTSTEADRKAVLDVIENECAAYLAKDFATWASCWSHAPDVHRWVSTTHRGVGIWDGWERQGPPMKRYMVENPLPSTVRYRHETMRIHVGADMAWATFDQHAEGGAGPEIDMPALNHELRILQKHADGWKIVCICSFQRSPDQIAAGVVEIDTDGAIVSMNALAKVALREKSRIRIVSGRLRAADRSVDKRLQGAIEWASYRDDAMWPRHGALPVVLGGGHGEPVDVCWVVARSQQTFVVMNNETLAEEQLQAAAAIYGITPAQIRLARLVLAGDDLVGAAAKLGVSVATTRTHMQRMFEKTGVHSQPALVRALLSVTTPFR